MASTMKGISKAARHKTTYQAALDTNSSSRTNPFLCAGCRHSLWRAIRSFSKDSHARSFTTRVGGDARRWDRSPAIDSRRRYHTTSQTAALEPLSTRRLDETLLIEEQSSHFRAPPPLEDASSVRSRLKQWRRETDSVVKNTNPGIADSIKVPSPQVQVPPPNSIGQYSDPGHAAEEELADLGLDTLADFQDDWSASTAVLNPGDLAQIRIPASGGPSESLCIMVRDLEGQSQFITAKGYWYMAASFTTLSSGIRAFVSTKELAPIMPYLPDMAIRDTQTGTLPSPINKIGDMPIDIAAPIVEKLALLESEITAFRHRHALAFEKFYETLADDQDLVEWSNEEVVSKVFGFPYSQLSTAGLLAIERFASQRENGVFASWLDAQPMGYWVRSRQDMRMKEEVMGWARQFQESAANAALGRDVKEDLGQNPLHSFIQKAHRLILKSRKIRSPTTVGLLGPSAHTIDGSPPSAISTGENLSNTDKQIIRFLFEVSQMKPPLTPARAQSISALIFRAIGAYHELPLEGKVAALLLQELGVIAPWAHRRINTYQYRLPGLGIWPQQERLLSRAEASCDDLSLFQDSMKHARRDWGSVPVYCIDNLDAQEIDDGLSVERDKNRPECVWIHVHVANPAAYISPDHPIALAAKGILSSTYTASRTFRMMPRKFTQELTSVAPDRPVITISTLLQADGSVKDIRLSLGMVHNVVKLTPGAVNRALGKHSAEQATMIVGGGSDTSIEDGRHAEIPGEALDDLNLMQQVLHQRRQHRLGDWPEEEVLRRVFSRQEVEVKTNISEEDVPSIPHKLAHWKGDPSIIIEADRLPQLVELSAPIGLVDSAMLLAGESAAKWCKERRIPIIYLAATPHPLFPISKLNKMETTEYRVEPGSRMSSAPLPHWSLSMWQYTRITSPIRRYPDLVNQWQIQAYIDSIGRLSGGGEPRPLVDHLHELPFTEESIKESVGRFGPIQSVLQRLKDISQQHWVQQAFFRAFHFNEAELPAVWDFKVIRLGKVQRGYPDTTGLVGYLAPFHADAELVISEEKWEQDVRRNQYLPVKIKQVDTQPARIIVKAVGPPSDTPTTRQPIHIRPSKRPLPPDPKGPAQQQERI